MNTNELSIENLLKTIEAKDVQIAALEKQVAWLTEQFKLSRHKMFGAKSEQTDPAQLSLFNEAEQTANLQKPEPAISEVKAHRRRRTRLMTAKLPDDLPVEIIEHELPEAERVCPDCGGAMHDIGSDAREELKIIPAQAVIVRHVRHTYACRHCEQTSDHVPIIKAGQPEAVIKGGFAAPETVAHIAVQKYVMASPLYRQEKEWEAAGILLSRQTMSNWLIKAADDWLKPVYNKMKTLLLAHEILHADETTSQVLREDGKPAQSKSFMWLYRTSGEAARQIVLYDYQRDRKAIRPAAFLKGFAGWLHTDGYEGYHNLPGTITIVGCWAHMRRKFDEALKPIPVNLRAASLPQQGLERCNRLFLLERQFVSLSPGERWRKRQELSKPLLEEFFAWVQSIGALPKSLLGQAVTYAQNQRKYLEAYLQDGRLEISNNRAENSIRPFTVGRKNWLFSNTPNGAEASAVYYSLIVTAQENGLHPYEYLTRVFTKAPNGAKLDELMPW